MKNLSADIDDSYVDVDENAYYLIEENDLDLIEEIRTHGDSRDLNLDNLVFITENGAVTATITHYTVQKRNDRNRLYFILRPAKAPENVCYAFAVRDKDGICVLIEETDPAIRQSLREWLEDEIFHEEIQSNAIKNKNKRGSGATVLFILSLPFRLILGIFKAVSRLFGMAFGDTPFVRGFKKGYSGKQSGMKEYRITNEMGCEQTVYSNDKKTFYNADGSYAGASNDGGKTLHD